MTCWLIPLTIVMILYGFIMEHFGDHIKTFLSRKILIMKTSGLKSIITLATNHSKKKNLNKLKLMNRNHNEVFLDNKCVQINEGHCLKLLVMT
jgi:hypothetical protein